MTEKECGHHHDESRRKLHRRLVSSLVTLVALVLFVILLVYLVLRPTKPHFTLVDATVYAFNLSGAGAGNLLTTTLQVTLSARNPNNRIGIYYDRLDVYAAYHGQPITAPTLLPPAYQGHKDVAVWSPFVYGSAVPVAPYTGAALAEDGVAGSLMLNVRVDGRVRWRVGTFVSGKYRVFVNCPAYINYGGGRGNGGIAVGAGVKYQLIMDCHVDV